MCDSNYKWCKDITDKDLLSEKDENGNVFCAFHAPADKKPKGWSNETIFKRIQYTIDNKQTCDLSGTVFDKDIDFRPFNDKNPLPAIRFSKAEFNGIANFLGAHFSGAAIFSGVVFTKDILFHFAEFKGQANFDNVVFRKAANFPRSQFKNRATFFNAQFKGLAEFPFAHFSGDVDFFYAQFIEWTTFHEASFEGKANFYRTIFSNKVSYSSAKFNGESRFYGETFAYKAFFTNVIIEETASIRFENVHLNNTSFIDTDFKNISFVNCKWHEENDRYILYDEIEALKENKVVVTLENGVIYRANKYIDKLALVQSIYNRLKQKYKAEHNEAEASKWHYGEKEMKRNATGISDTLNWLFLNIYWLTSGYGEMPKRALLWLIGFIVVLTALPEYALADDIKSYDIISSALALARLMKDSLLNAVFDLKSTYKLIGLLMKTLIPLQATFLAIAVRNRFRR